MLDFPKLNKPKVGIMVNGGLLEGCGFKSKTEANMWRNSLGSKLNWSAGAVFSIRGMDSELVFVDKHLVPIKY